MSEITSAPSPGNRPRPAMPFIVGSAAWVGVCLIALRVYWARWILTGAIGPEIAIEVAAGLPVALWAIALARGARFEFGRREAFALVLAAGLLRLALLTAPPAQSDDAYRYLWEGRVQRAGMNPFEFPPGAPQLAGLRDAGWERVNHREHSAIYPPLAQWVFLLVAAIWPTMTGIKLAFTLCDLLVLIVLLRWLARLGRSPAWAAVWAFHPLAIVEFSGNGHVDSLMILAIVTALWCLDEGWERRAALALAGAVAAKLIPLALLPYFIWRMKRWWLLGLVPALVVVGYLPYAGAGLIQPIGAWTDAPRYDPATGLTALTDYRQTFEPGALTGYLMNPDSREPHEALIADNNTTTIHVEGDVTGYVQEGDKYEVFGGLARSLWVYQRDWIYNAPIFSFARDRLFGADGWLARWWFYGALGAIALALWLRRTPPAGAVLPVLGFYQVAGPVVHPWYLALFAAMACVRAGGWPWLWLTLAAPLVYWGEQNALVRAAVWAPFLLLLGVQGIVFIRRRRGRQDDRSHDEGSP